MKKTVLLLLALAPAALAAVVRGQRGRFDAGTKYEAPASHAPANVSRMYVRTLERADSVELPAAGGSSMIIWTIPVTPNAAV